MLYTKKNQEIKESDKTYNITLTKQVFICVCVGQYTYDNNLTRLLSTYQLVSYFLYSNTNSTYVLGIY